MIFYRFKTSKESITPKFTIFHEGVIYSDFTKKKTRLDYNYRFMQRVDSWDFLQVNNQERN
jgi:hypothetical protein